MQHNMYGFSKKIILFLLFLAVIGCNKNEKSEIGNNDLIVDGKSLIRQNSNVLIDSLERYDLRFLNKDEKLEPFTVAVLDSITIDERYSKYSQAPLKFFTFKLEGSDFSNFESPYTLELVTKDSHQSNVIFVSFSNLKIEGSNAEVLITKINGISSVTDRYYFKKLNNKWVFLRKKQLGMG